MKILLLKLLMLLCFLLASEIEIALVNYPDEKRFHLVWVISSLLPPPSSGVCCLSWSRWTKHRLHENCLYFERDRCYYDIVRPVDSIKNIRGFTFFFG